MYFCWQRESGISDGGERPYEEAAHMTLEVTFLTFLLSDDFRAVLLQVSNHLSLKLRMPCKQFVENISQSLAPENLERVEELLD